MKLQQLRYLREIVRRGLNVSEAANALYTSQPGISKQIRLLEEELGIQVLVRRGKRVVDLTEPGRIVLEIAERMLHDADNLKAVGREFGVSDTGALNIALGPADARYAVPPAIQRFVKRHPRVRIALREGIPEYIADLVARGDADLGIISEPCARAESLVTLPCGQWHPGVLTPAEHPLLRQKALTLEALARYPILAHDCAVGPGSGIRKAFETRNLELRIALTAGSVDVIKAHVELGLGVGIIPTIAFAPERDTKLRLIDAAHLFEPATTRIALRRNAYLRRYMFDFIEMFAPHLSRAVVEKTMTVPGSDYEL